MASQWGLGIILILSAGFALFGGAVIDLMAKAAEVQAEARVYLVYMVAAPVAGLAAWMLDGVFIGATRTSDMRNMMAVSLAVYVLAVVLLMPDFGNHGLWLALLISYIARGVTLGLALSGAGGRCRTLTPGRRPGGGCTSELGFAFAARCGLSCAQTPARGSDESGQGPV